MVIMMIMKMIQPGGKHATPEEEDDDDDDDDGDDGDDGVVI